MNPTKLLRAVDFVVAVLVVVAVVVFASSDAGWRDKCGSPPFANVACYFLMEHGR